MKKENDSPVRDILLHSQIIDFVSKDMQRVQSKLNKDIGELPAQKAIRSPYEVRYQFNSSSQKDLKFKRAYLLALESIRIKKQRIEQGENIVLVCISCECETVCSPSNILGDSYETTIIVKFSPMVQTTNGVIGT